MAVSSLPSPYGIGTLGKAARDFIDFLADAGQSWWQILPVGPTGYGDSPYQSVSSFAGNPYLIDLDLLVEDGLLTQEEIDGCRWGDDPAKTDYGLLYQNRFPLLERATIRGWNRDRPQVEAFEAENESWLPDYALFMALKRHFGMAPWTQWPDREIRLREAHAMEQYRVLLQDDIRMFTYIQFLFYRQWKSLRTYAREKGVGIIGDLPIYVALDSVDVWSSPESFQLDREHIPVAVSGVPPDFFSTDGQLWGNPLYDYEAMAKNGYGWWIRRIGGAEKLFDMIRIDHFRGLESYWAVPYGEKTAKNGKWVKGPGMDLLRVLTGWFHNLPFIAEDLGYPSPEVHKLLADSGLPGMKVLEFAFDSRESSSYLPHRYPANCVCYTGTHDNPPLRAWLEEIQPADLAMAKAYLGLNREEGYTWGILRGGMSSVADLFIAQIQDYLELGAESRMNTPGTAGGNWQWRLLPGQITPELTRRIADMSLLYGRSEKKKPEQKTAGAQGEAAAPESDPPQQK